MPVIAHSYDITRQQYRGSRTSRLAIRGFQCPAHNIVEELKGKRICFACVGKSLSRRRKLKKCRECMRPAHIPAKMPYLSRLVIYPRRVHRALDSHYERTDSET